MPDLVEKIQDLIITMNLVKDDFDLIKLLDKRYERFKSEAVKSKNKEALAYLEVYDIVKKQIFAKYSEKDYDSSQ